MPNESRQVHDPIDPDHHLWRNGRLWWVAFTVHLPGWQKERVRLSLGTADLARRGGGATRCSRDYPHGARLRAVAAARGPPARRGGHEPPERPQRARHEPRRPP